MEVIVNGIMSDEEAQQYINRARERYRDALKKLTITPVDEEEVELAYELDARPFERVRRITGYLVGTLDKWNDGKRAEEHDRVKHGLTSAQA